MNIFYNMLYNKTIEYTTHIYVHKNINIMKQKRLQIMIYKLPITMTHIYTLIHTYIDTQQQLQNQNQEGKLNSEQ